MNILIILLTLICTSHCIKKSYDGHKLFGVSIKTENDIDYLNSLRNQLPLTFWETYLKQHEEAKVMVSEEYETKFRSLMKEGNIKIVLKSENVQELINAQLKPATNKHTRASHSRTLDWVSYHDLESIYSWLDELEHLYPNIVKTTVIGPSNENRDIKGVIIDFRPEERDENSLHYIIEAGIHSREWIATATATWIINELLTSSDPELREMARLFVWHIIPVANPDGYAYTFTDDRLWRKSRNNHSTTTCGTWFLDDDASNGVDLNRNFDMKWMTIGASANPCAQDYAGPEPFSEAEARALANYVFTVQGMGNLMYYIAFHSYSQLLLLPPADLAPPQLLVVENFGDLFEIGKRAMDKLKERNGIEYETGASGDILYHSSGSSRDWVKQAANVPIVFTYEFRDSRIGPYGFLLPPDQIVPNSEEVMDSLVEMHKVTMKLGYYSSSGSLLRCSGLAFVLVLAARIFMG